jgi:hypothetical protein
VKIYFSKSIPMSHSYFMYDTIRGWYNYSEHVAISNDRTSITVALKDGDYGDSDGIENGIIVDPGGFGLPSTGGSGSSNFFSNIANPVESASCFIKSTWHIPDALRECSTHLSALRVVVIALVSICQVLINMFGSTGTVAVLLLTGIALTRLLRMHGTLCSEDREARAA